MASADGRRAGCPTWRRPHRRVRAPRRKPDPCRPGTRSSWAGTSTGSSRSRCSRSPKYSTESTDCGSSSHRKISAGPSVCRAVEADVDPDRQHGGLARQRGELRRVWPAPDKVATFAAELGPRNQRRRTTGAQLTRRSRHSCSGLRIRPGANPVGGRVEQHSCSQPVVDEADPDQAQSLGQPRRNDLGELPDDPARDGAQEPIREHGSQLHDENDQRDVKVYELSIGGCPTSSRTWFCQRPPAITPTRNRGGASTARRPSP